MWRAFHFCVYITFRFFLILVGITPISLVFLVGFLAGDVAYCLLWKRRRLAHDNIVRAFRGRKNPEALRALARRHFRLLGANLLCCFKIVTMSRDRILQRVTVVNPAKLEVPPEEKRSGWVAMISHLSNWELFVLLTALLPEYQFGAVYQKLANPFIDRYMRAMRTRTGVSLFERGKGFLQSVDFLREGGVVGVLVDQSAGYAGLWAPFFDRLASCSTLAASLAKRAGVPIVPIAISTLGIARWSVELSNPIESDHDEIELLTTEINRQLEHQIEKSPADWLWSHNRWKALRPHFLLTRDQRRHYLPPDYDRKSLDLFRILLQSPKAPSEAQCSLPAIRAIKTGRPDTFLCILASPSMTHFWKGVPEVDEVIETPAAFRPSRSNIALLRRFDAAIVIFPSFWTALALFFAGIPIRVGPRKSFRSCFFNQYLPDCASESHNSTLVYLRIAQSIGANINLELTQLHSPSPN